MKDDPDPTASTIRSEWALLLHSFLDEIANPVEIIDRIQVEQSTMNLDEIESLKKKLSDERKIFFQRIEVIKIQLEEKNQLVSNLELVGSNTDEVQAEIAELQVEGQQISDKIERLDLKIKKLHEVKEALLIHQQAVS